MLRSLFTWFLLLGSALALAACCANDPCDCRDGTDDAVYLKFSLDTTSAGNNTGTGFAHREIRNVYIRRQAVRAGLNDTLRLPAPDSVLLTRTRFQLRDSILLSPATPFTNRGRRFDAYRYTVRLPITKRRTDTFRTSFVLSDLSVQGDFTETSGCCTCYQNKIKKLTLDGISYDFSNRPVQTLVLKR